MRLVVRSVREVVWPGRLFGGVRGRAPFVSQCEGPMAHGKVPPIVVILGSTGTGKTKLSLELAARYGGEVISADSMQVYKGLDIVTAKATKAEQQQAPHHLLDVATPDQAFTVTHFREKALPIRNVNWRGEEKEENEEGFGNTFALLRDKLPLSSLRSVQGRLVEGGGGFARMLTNSITARSERALGVEPTRKNDVCGAIFLNAATQQIDSLLTANRMPIIVGGTNYYIESVLWKVLIGEGVQRERTRKRRSSGGQRTSDSATEQQEQEPEQEELVRLLPALQGSPDALEGYGSTVLHQALQRVDPGSANRLHPNNKRKIVRDKFTELI
uniref:tRNA dimethylallyltransferase n=1 Tax=Anopheles atroparvus TaxID=41427 RepID=A0A182IR86_ANOAO